MIRNFEEITYALTTDERLIAEQIKISFLKKKEKGEVGRKHAVKNAVIQKAIYEKFGIKLAPARIRHIITVLRNTGEVENLCSTSVGYYLAAKAEDLRDTITSLEDRLTSQIATIEALKIQYRKNFGAMPEDLKTNKELF